jgi:transposase-like protein
MYAYGSSDNFYTNLRYKQEPWRGMTAMWGGRPYLIVDKEGDDFILEGENGESARGQHFDWNPTTPGNRLVAASRLEDSIFKQGNIVGGYEVGSLAYRDGHWLIRVGDSDNVFPLDHLLEELDDAKWDKQAFSMKYAGDSKSPVVCPNCGSHTLRLVDKKEDSNKVVCLTCRNEFQKKALTYPEDPNMQAQLIGLMQQLATANEQGNRDEVRRIQAEIEKIMGGYDADRMVAPGMPTSAPASGSPFGGRLYSMVKEAPGKEHMKGVSPKRNRQYEHILESCKKEHPDWSEDRCKELAARTVNKQRSEKGETKSSAEKFTPGTRVQVTHPKHKGQRGTITEFKGKQDDIDEEKYQILLDSGDTLEELNESFFEKIKSANVNLPDSPLDYFLGSMSVEAQPYGDPAFSGGDPMMEDPMMSGPPMDPMMDAGAPPMDAGPMPDPTMMPMGEDEYQVPECPMCGGPGSLLGSMGRKTYFRCDNCGVDFFDEDDTVLTAAVKEGDDFGGKLPSMNRDKPETFFEVKDDNWHADEADYPWDEPEEQKLVCPNCKSNVSSQGVRGPVEHFICTNAECRMEFGIASEPPAEHIENDPAELFGEFESSKTAYTDVKGEALKPGNWYTMHHKDYPVPDTVRVLNIEDSHLEAAIASDEDNHFPIRITLEEGYSFEPYEESESVEVVSKSGWKLARRNYSAKEQRELIDENPEGRARNADKLDLSGTHYEIKNVIVEKDDLDQFFI